MITVWNPELENVWCVKDNEQQCMSYFFLMEVFFIYLWIILKIIEYIARLCKQWLSTFIPLLFRMLANQMLPNHAKINCVITLTVTFLNTKYYPKEWISFTESSQPLLMFFTLRWLFIQGRRQHTDPETGSLWPCWRGESSDSVWLDGGADDIAPGAHLKTPVRFFSVFASCELATPAPRGQYQGISETRNGYIAQWL